jgi:uncharacterized delta-60 repeat protein
MNKTLGAARAQKILLGITCGSLLSVAFASGCGDDSNPTGTTGAGGGSTTAATTAAATTAGVGGATAASSSTGAVIECNSPNDCPDPGNECIARLCFDHACGTLNAAFGTPLKDQSDGDCKQAVCDGNGATTSINDATDTLDDAKQCTIDACKSGAVTHDAAIAGTVCSEGGGTLCDGNGACVGCVSAANCAPGAICSGGACVSPTCADGVKNGTEVDVDCGGAACAKCDVAKACTANGDCKSGLCAANNVCATTDPIITAISATGHDRFFNVTFDAAGNILAVGVVTQAIDAATDFATVVARFSPSGVLDTTFGTNGYFIKNITVGTNGELARAIGVQSDGKIIVAATVDHLGAADARDRDVAVLRLNTNGTLDTTFGTNGVQTLDLSTGMLVGTSFLADSVWHLVVQPDDKIAFTGGQVRPGGMDTDYAMVRLLKDGALDPAFGTAGKVLVDVGNNNASARSITLLPDGSLLGAGYMDLNGVGTPLVYKVNSAGVLDTTFGSMGVYNAVVLAAQTEAYAVVPQGAKFVTTGYGRANAMTESLDWLSLRFLPNGTLDSTYGTNGVARIDIGGFNDNSRQVIVLPDNRVVLNGGGRLTANNVDGAIGVLTPNGQPDTTFAPSGVKVIDLGGPSDFLWGMALSPSKKYIVMSGIKGVAAPANDDSALVLIPVP